MPDPRIVEIRRLYDEADSLAREVGELRSEVQIPAINELRYAGHHALQAITDDGAVDIEVLASAKSHCERAMYEAAEAGIMFCLDAMKDFRKTYRDLVISEVIADYPSRLARVQTALDLVVKGRSGRTSVGEEGAADPRVQAICDPRPIASSRGACCRNRPRVASDPGCRVTCRSSGCATT